jgi:aarF domain-containing kinase
MPLTFEEFKRSLVNQTDLRFEAKNLDEFNSRFAKNPNVIFPVPVSPYISASVLVESWEEGIPLTKFLTQERGPDHLTLANLGLKMFYKMLIFDNFIHADCHAGNMFIRITPRHISYDKMSYF